LFLVSCHYSSIVLHPWQEFYDTTTNDVVKATTNTTLNGKLYAKLLICLEGQVLQNTVSRKHLRANGLLLLHKLLQTYKPRRAPEVIAAKTGEFWSQLKHSLNESIDSYYNRFHELLDDLLEADGPIPMKSAIHHFIFMLGLEFKMIQNNFCISNLPSEWQT